MSHDILLCGPFVLSDVNGACNQIVSGVAAPVTTVGFAHSIERDLRSRVDPDLAIRGAGVVVHRASMKAGHPKFPPAEQTLSERKEGPEVLDEIKVDAIVTFVLAIGHDGDGDVRQDAVDAARAALPGILLNKRYAGATLHPKGDRNDIVGDLVTPKDQAKALKSLREGYMLRDRRDHLEDQIAQGKDPLTAVMETVGFKREGNVSKRLHPTALTPIAVGYQAIEQPRLRSTHRPARDAPLHVYAEPLTGIGQWVHVRRLAGEEDPLAGCLWTHHHDPRRGLYYASATGKI